jgi:putative ATP-dependent endonuclease of OLD family
MKHTYISHVEIHNFRNFGRFSVDLSPAAVVIGENRVGKSNLIEALRLIFDPSMSDTARKLREEDFWDGLTSPFDGNEIKVSVLIRDFDENPGVKCILGDSIVNQAPLTAKVTYKYRPKARRDSGDSRQPEQPKLTEEDYDFVVFGGDDESNQIGGDIRKWISLLLLPALRDAEADLQNWRRSPLRPLLERTRKQIPNETLTAVREELDRAKGKLLQDQAVLGLVDAINEQVRTMAGPVHSIETELDFASTEPDQLIRSLRLFLKGPASRPISGASLGSANILFLSLLLQDMEMRQQAKEIVGTILAIEEPEAHLHPQLQRLLFRYFLGRSHSVIVTTHSPNIARVAPLASIVLLRKVGDESKGFTSLGLNLNKGEVEDLQRYLDVTRAEMLFARAVILVEGPAEEFLVPAFADAYFKKHPEFGCSTLDDLGISVCAVNGTDFAPFHRLLSDQGLAIPHVVITDGDFWIDEDGNSKYPGLRRGIRLLDEKSQDAVQGLLDENEPGDAAAVLSGHYGVFVGDQTLEVDLIRTMANEMKKTYQELRNSERASSKFDDSVRKIESGKTESEVRGSAINDVLARIDYVGKGRFAQSLAGKVKKGSAPSYIEEAIASIVNLLVPDAEKAE